VVARARSIVGRIQRSPWASLLARVVIVTVGLVVLACIGRAAAAATADSPRVEAPPSDAGPPRAFVEMPAPILPASAVAEAAPPSTITAPSARAAHARATVEDPVFVNHAGVEELRRLPGVGPKRAEAIVALRQRVGRFQRIEDLLRVKGIGRATIRKWRPLLRLEAPPAPGPDGGAP
jgi:competence protein ComEA